MRGIKVGKQYSISFAAAAVAACLVILAVVGISQSAAITRQLNAWKLLPQPERLSELYFENHAKLRTTYLPGVEQQFQFTLHNLEYEPAEYSYTVAEESEDGSASQQVASGDFRLEQDTRKTTGVAFAPTDLGKRVKVVTTVTIRSETSGTKTQEIHYWVTKEGA